jgi:hypothetical protein
VRCAAIAVACGILAFASPSAADETPIQTAMHDYFAGELREGWVFAGFGAAGVGGGALAAFAAKDDFYRGAGWPVLAIGAIQLAAGVVLLFRTSRQIEERDRLLATAPRSFYELERPRMEKVRREFGLLEIGELGLTAVGVGLAALGGARRDHTIAGVGVGLAFESALMLAFDGRASMRADVYSGALERSDPGARWR